MLHVGAADRRDESEVDEDEQLAEAVVAVRSRSAGVEPSREHGGRADRDEPPRRARREPQTRTRTRSQSPRTRRCARSSRRPASRPSIERDRRAPRRCRARRRSSRWRSSSPPAATSAMTRHSTAFSQSIAAGRTSSVPITTGTAAAGSVLGRAASTQRRYRPG